MHGDRGERFANTGPHPPARRANRPLCYPVIGQPYQNEAIVRNGPLLRMITILHVITGLDTGGAEMMLYKLVARSDPAQFQHIVVSLTQVGPVGEKIGALGVPVHSLRMRRGVADPRALLRLLALMRHVRPDVVQTWLYHADALGTLAAAVLRVPVVWNIRSSIDVNELGPVVAALARLCARLSRVPAAVVTNSEAAKVLHTRLGYRPRKWLVIPNGFDTKRFAPDVTARRDVRRELGLPADTLLVGFVARFDPLKDHQTLLRAAGLLRRQLEGPHFVLIGRDITISNPELREWIEAGGVGDHVHLLGERADIPRLTAALDIATCSSYSESFPNIIGEAMACAVPCVVTDVGDAARIVGETGCVVPPKDAPALASAWRELIELGPAGRQELGLRARARVEERYSLDSVVWQYETLYERLMKRRLDVAVRST
jgi:glycosyltransferase involved in cell wall biosynthesis